jgi:hypothetical protein
MFSMRRFTGFFIGLLLGAGSVFFVYNFHVIRAGEGFLLVPKPQNSLADPYCDIREWKGPEWEKHTTLAGALVAHGRSDLVVAPAASEILRDVLKKFGSAGKDKLDSRIE